MQNFWSKQSNAIKQDSFHINDERSLIKQLMNQLKFFLEKNFIFDQWAISINDSNTIKKLKFIKLWARNL
jgi:hypothetical protein